MTSSLPRQSSTIGRPIDLKYPTNRAILVFSLLTLALFTALYLFNGREFGSAILGGFAASFGVFFGWALTREIDPDHDLAAFVAGGLVFAGMIVWRTPLFVEFLAIFSLLQLFRILNRSAGKEVAFFDAAFVFAVSLPPIFFNLWLYGLAAGLIFLLDALLVRPQRRHLGLAGLSIIAAVIAYFFVNGNKVGAVTLPYLIGMTAISMLFLVAVVRTRKIVSVGDFSGKRLHLERIQGVRIVSFLTCVSVAWWQGDAGAVSLLILWATLLGIGLFPWIARLLPKIDLSPRK